MKFITLFLLFVAFQTEAQTFQQTITGPINTYFRDAVQTPDDGFLMVGSFRPSTFDSAGAILTKLNPDLEVQWTRRYKYLGGDDFEGITALADGNYLIYGAARQDFTLECGGSLIKIDVDGNVIWDQVYDHVCDDRTIEVFENADNTLLLFIRYGVTGRATKVIKTDALGNIVSKFIYKLGTDEVKIETATQDASGNIYMSGTIRDSILNTHIFVIKYDGVSTVWSKQFSTGRSVHTANTVYALQDGSIVIAGVVIVDGSSTNFNYLMLHIGDTGSLLNAKELDLAGNETGAGIVETSDGHFIMTGSSTDFISRGTAMKFDLAANLIWTRSYGADPDFIGLGKALELNDGRLLFLGGENFTDSYQILASPSGITPCDVETVFPIVTSPSILVTDMTLTTDTSPVVEAGLILSESTYSVNRSVVCTDSVELTGIEPQPDFRVSFYPNPASDYLVINSPEEISVNYSIVNSSGRKVGSGTIDKGSSKISIYSFVPGIYFIKELGVKFLVVR